MDEDPRSISRELYSKIHALMPIPCVDLVVTRNGNMLLLQRAEEPLKNEEYFPGGRLHKGEAAVFAALRILVRETGLISDLEFGVKFLAVIQMTFKEDPFGHGYGTHAVSFVYQVRALEGEVKLDSTSTRSIWRPIQLVASGDLKLHRNVIDMARKVTT